MPTIFHTDKAALREFRRQNDCTSREAKIAAALQALSENGCIALHFGDKAHQDYIRSKGATLSIGGKLVSQIQLKREHWEEVIDSLNFALSGQGCRKDGHGLGKNARAFFNYCSVLPKRDHKYRDWNDLTWSFDEANVADIQNVKIWQRGYQKRRREEKRMEEGGLVPDVDDKCVAKVREEPREEAKKPKTRAPKAAPEAAKVAPAMPSREDVSALMTLHQAMLEASCAS